MDDQPSLEASKDLSRLLVLHRGSGLLRMSGAAIQTTAAIGGLSVAILVSVAIHTSAPDGSVAARLFDLNRLQGALPAAMLGMFFWGAILLGVRRLRVGQAERISNPKNLRRFLDCISNLSLDDLFAAIDKTSLSRSSLLLRRLRVVVRQWFAKPCLQDSLSLLNQQAVEDVEEIHHAYGVIKTFVWSLPVLGLIGTVVGIALAVGDFGQLIGGNVDDVVVIKQSLVQVTSGLSFAFTTTLLGLLAALLLVLPSAAVQAREEKLVTTTEGIVTDAILPLLQRLYPEGGEPTAVPDAELWRSTLAEIAQAAVRSAAATADRLLAESYAALAAMHRERSAELEKAADAVAAATGRIGADLRAASDEFLSRLGLVRESMDEQAKVMRETMDRGSAAAEQGATRLDAAMAQQADLARDLATQIQAIQAGTASLLSAQTAMSAAMRELIDSGATGTLEALSLTLEAVNRQAQAIDRTLAGVAGATERLTECQAALQAGLRQIDTVGLPSALDGLGQTLTGVSEVLQGFQGPIVFQAVRASPVAGAGTGPGKPATQGEGG